ncbi:hypothetical protein ACT691_06440 [Vibrio metschnikovii]
MYEVLFRTHHWPIFVVEPSSDRLCWLYPEDAGDMHSCKITSPLPII